MNLETDLNKRGNLKTLQTLSGIAATLVVLFHQQSRRFCGGMHSWQSLGGDAQRAKCQMRPKVSAVIPVYNGERFLSETIESVLGQTYPNIECIVVNDGSTDASGEIARSFGDRIRYFEKPNGGVSSARNFGIEKSEGELIAFLDADDLWAADKIAKQVEVFMNDRSVGLIHSGVVIIDEAAKPIGKVVKDFRGDPVSRILMLQTPVYLTMTGVVPRRVFDVIGGFNEKLSTSADAEMACRIGLKYKIVAIEEPLASYRQHGNQMHLNLGALEHDSKILFENIFLSDGLPERLVGMKPKALASLETTLAIGYRSKGLYARALQHLFRGLRTSVPTTMSMLNKALMSRFTK